MSDATADLDISGLSNAVEIGVGGFATVYKADQPAFRRTVAVKVIAAPNLDDAARERFERECQAMGSLSEHPHIVTVYDNGFTASGRPYLVMAFLPGGSLAERIEREGPLGWQEATLAGVHVAGALETAHRAQIIHRDIKPANVLVSSFGDAQLTDFGIARISGGHETRSGVITASMAHAPPEVLDGQRPSVSGDVYSLGSTIFELIYGHPAYEDANDESMVPMLRRILSDPPPDLRPRGVPDDVCRVLERAMAKDPAQRQASALQFGRELQAARRAAGLEAGRLTVPADVNVGDGDDIAFVAAPSQVLCTHCHADVPAGADRCPSCGTVVGAALPPSPTAQVPIGGQTGPYVPGGPPQAPRPRRTGLLVGVGVLVLALVVAGVIIALSAGRGGDPVAATTTTTTSVVEDSSTTSSTVAEGYTPQVETNFVEACQRGGGGSPLLCRCIFRGIKDQVPFREFVAIERQVSEGGSLKGTAIEQIVKDCAAEDTGAAGGGDPGAGAGDQPPA